MCVCVCVYAGQIHTCQILPCSLSHYGFIDTIKITGKKTIWCYARFLEILFTGTIEARAEDAMVVFMDVLNNIQ